MRRILPTALAVALLVGAFAGVASARLANDGPAAPAAAPFRAPAAMPLPDAAQPGAYGFSTSEAIAATLQAPAARPTSTTSPASADGASASVTITATVLPVVTIVVDPTGDVVEIVTNTPDRDARGVLYVVRRDAPDGAAAPLDAATWAAARAALAEAHVGSGTVWTA